MRDGSVGSSPGWYPDPGGEHDLRYHNGVDWTGDVSTDGERHVAPLGAALAAPGEDDHGSATGTAPLVLGIIALCIAWIPFVSVIGGGVAIAAIVIGARRRSAATASNAANAGIIMGAVGLVLAIFGTWLAVMVLGEVRRFEDPGPYEINGLECEEIDGVTRATGSIENLSGTTRSYTIEVSFDAEHTESVEVSDVEAGSAAPFVVDENLRFDELACAVDTVNGPFPFGLDIRL